MAGSDSFDELRRQTQAAQQGPSFAAGKESGLRDPLADRAALGLSQDSINFRNSLRSPLEDRASLKSDQVQERLARKQQEVDANNKSLVSRLGMKEDSLMGWSTNMGASVQGMAARIAADLAGAPAAMFAASQQAGITPEQMAAYQRVQADETGSLNPDYVPQATDEDRALLAAPYQAPESKAPASPFSFKDDSPKFGRFSYENADEQPELEGARGAGKTVQDRIATGEGAREVADFGYKLADNFANSWVHQGNRDALNAATEGGGEAVLGALDGIKKMVGGDLDGGASQFGEKAYEALGITGNALKEWRGLSEYVAETGAQLLASAMPGGMMAQTVGYATRLETQGIKEYQDKNDGQLPPPEVQAEITRNALGAGVLNYLGDAALLGKVAAPFKREVVKDAAGALSGRASVARTTKATGAGMATEGGTEAAQTYLEGQATLQPVSADEIFRGGFIGAIAGGAMTGGSHVAAEVTKSTEAQREAVSAIREEAVAQQAEAQANVDQVADTQEAGELADVSSPKFNPEQALIGLYQSLDNPDTTPEQVLEVQSKIDTVIGDTSAHVEERREVLEIRTPEGRAIQEQLLADAQASGDTTLAAIFQRDLDEALSMTDEQAQAEAKRLDDVEEKLKQTVQTRGKIDSLAAPAKKSQEAAVPVVEAAVKGDRDSGDALLVMAMRNPDSLSTDQLDQVAQSTDLDIPTEQREYLTALSQSQKSLQKLKTLDNVTTDIISGGKGFKGVEQYRARTQALLRVGRTADATKQIKSLTKFADQHTQKAEAVRKAYNEIKGTQHSVSLVRDTDGAWKRVTRKISRKERKEKTGLTIDARSFKLADAIDMEAEVVRNTNAELTSAIAVAQGLDTRAAEDVEETGPETQTERETSASEASREVLDTDLTTNAPAADITTEAPAPVEGPTSSIAPADLEPAVTTPGPGRDQAGATPVLPRDQAGTTPAPARPVAGTVTVQTPESTGAAAIDTVSAVTDEQGQRVASVTLAREDGVSGLVPRLRIGRSVAKDPARAVSVATQAYQQIQSQNEGVRIYAPAEAKMSNQLKPVWNQMEQEGTAVRDENNRLYLAEPVQEAAQEPAQEAIESTSSEATPEAAQAPVATSEEASLDAQAEQEAALQEQAEEAAPEVVNQSAEEVAADQQEEAVPEVDEQAAAVDESAPAERVRKETAPSRLRKLLTARPKYQRLKAAEYQTTNLVEAHLRQGKANGQPLAEEGDFLADLMADTTLADEYLEEPMSAEQTAAVMANAQLATQLIPFFNAALEPHGRETKGNKSLNPNFYYQDMAEFLRDKDSGNFDENVLNAIVMSSVQAVLDQASEGYYATPKEINKSLGRSPDAPVPKPLEQLLADKGVRARLLHNSIGKNIVRSLGIKLKVGAPENTLRNLETSLGAHALAGLLEAKIFEMEEIPNQQIQDLLPNLDDKGFASEDGDNADAVVSSTDYVTHNFVRLNRDLTGAKLPEIQEVIEANRGTAGVWGKLLGADSRQTQPSFKPVTLGQTTAQNSPMGIPNLQRKVLNAEGAKKHFLKENVTTVLSSMDRERLYRMAGVVEKEAYFPHAANNLSREGKNEALIREVDNLFTWYDTVAAQGDGLNTPFFIPRSVWKMQRVGMDSNLFNPLSSKVQRHAMYMEGWETEIDLTDQDSVDSFLLAVADAMDIDTDKQTNVASLREVVALFDPSNESPRAKKLQAGVQALMSVMEGNAPDAETQQVIEDAVAATKTKFHGLDALVELADMTVAGNKGQKKFTTRLMREVDGVTNGPILTQLMLGAAPNLQAMEQLLEKGGMFSQDSTIDQYGTWRSTAGNRDLYESLAAAIHVNAKTHRESDPEINQQYRAIEYFTKPLFDEDSQKLNRNLVKKPLTALVFGSSMKASVQSLAMSLEPAFYDKLEEIFNSNDTQQSKDYRAAQAITAMNVLLGNKKLNPRMGIEQAMNTALTTPQLTQMVHTFEESMGEAIETTFDNIFSVFLANRARVNTAAQTAFELYNIAFKTMRRSALNQMAARGELPAVQGEVIGELDSDQVEAIKKQLEPLLPVLHSPMSRAERNLGAGIFLGKFTPALSKTPAYQGKARIEDNNNMSLSALVPQLAGPSVAGLILGMHSTDSTISTRAYAKLNALNVHDAHGLGINNIAEGARNLNQATFNTMMNYSLPSETADALDRVIQNFEKVLGTYGSDPKTMQDLTKLNNDLAGKLRRDDEAKAIMNEQGVNGIGAVSLLARSTAQKADTMKLQTMLRMSSMDQYAFEGGNYKPNDDDRVVATHRLKSIPQTAPETLEAIESLTQAVKNKSLAEQQLDKNAEAAESIRMEGDESLEGATEELRTVPAADQVAEPDAAGPSDVASDPVIIDLVDQHHGKSVHSLAKAFMAQTSNAQYRGMVAAMLKTIPKSAMVRVTKQGRKLPAGAKPLPRGDLAATRFDASAEVPFEIWFRNSKGTNRQMTGEVLVHELVHLATNLVIAAVQKNGTKNAELQQIVTGLETLLADAQALVKERGLSKWEYATSDVFEMVSFGMSNPEFQQEVMSQLEVTTEKHPALKGNSLLSGMRAFIQYLAGVVFGDKARTHRDGLTTLIAYTAGIQGATRDADLGQDLSRDTFNNVLGGSLDFAYRPEEIFESLDDLNHTGEDTQYLRDLMAKMVEEVHGPMGALKEEAFDGTDPVDGFLEAVVNDRMPFASGLSNSGYAMTDREAYVAEQLHATFLTAIDGDQTAYREMSNLWHEAKAALPVEKFHNGDWSQASKGEKDLAEQRRNFLFDLTGSGRGRSDHIARFAAASLVLPQLRNLMDFQTADRTKSLRGMKLGEAMQELFRRLTSLVNGFQLKIRDGQSGDQRLNLLAQRLVDVDAKTRRKVQARDRQLLDRVDDATEQLSAEVRKKIEAFGKTRMFRKSRSGVIRFAGSAMSTVAGQRAEQFTAELMKWRNKTHENQLPGLGASIFNEARGAHDKISRKMQQIFREVSKANEHRRMQVMTTTKQLVLENFENSGKDLTREQREALTPVLIRSGMADLVGTYDMNQLTDLVTRPSVRRQEIARLESELQAIGEVGSYYAMAAQDLGHFLATGKSTNPELMRNAHNIAHLGGLVGDVLTAPADADSHIESIDALATLYALENGKTEQLKAVGDVMRRELARGTENGAEATLLMAKSMQDQSLSALFNGSPVLMSKGYSTEILDPNISMKVATEKEGRDLMRMGWEKHGDTLMLDRNDPDKTARALYTIRDGGTRAYLSGMMSNTSEQSQGADMYDRASASKPAAQRAQALHNKRLAEVRKMLKRPASYKASTATETYAVPILNEFGETVTHRYMMQEDTRDNVMRRQNDIGEVMGGMAGSLYDKPVSKAQNKTVVDALYQAYAAEVRTNSEAYVEVSATSSNPAMREAWNLLPEETKAYVAEVWGDDKMMVRGDLADMTFGYRKSSIASLVTNASVHQSTTRDVIANTFAYLANVGRQGDTEERKAARTARMAQRLRVAEDVWSEVVKHVKDILVVKSGITLAGNISSNMSLLLWYGVSPTEIARDHKESIEGLIHYRRDLAERDKLQAMLDAEYVDSIPAAQQRIAELNDALDRNKVKELIDAGMLPTIVEDVDLQEDSFSYQSRAQEKLSKLTDRIPKPLRTGAKWTYMAHDTPIYKILSQGTQMSDFVARYTLYKHATNRKKDALGREEALQVASDMFINYDLPSHRHLNYANEVGLLMFTKYYIRIQKTIMHLYQERPARAMALTALTGFLPGLPVLMDSAFWHRLYSPLRAGALEAPGVADDLATVNLGLSLFD